jgi:hypothetical protein
MIGSLAFGRITTKGKRSDFDYLRIINDYQYIFSKNSLIFEDIKKKEKYKIEISEKTFKNSHTKTKFYLFYIAREL